MTRDGDDLLVKVELPMVCVTSIEVFENYDLIVEKAFLRSPGFRVDVVSLRWTFTEARLLHAVVLSSEEAFHLRPPRIKVAGEPNRKKARKGRDGGEPPGPGFGPIPPLPPPGDDPDDDDVDDVLRAEAAVMLEHAAEGAGEAEDPQPNPP